VVQESSAQPGQPATALGRPYPPAGAGESPWPAQLTVLAAICLQLALPERLTVGPTWLVPALEGALLVGMFVATPRQLEGEHRRRRRVALGLTAFVSAANVYSLAALTHFLLHHNVSDGHALIGSGVLIWLTNFLIFALWYWELDRGGPAARLQPDHRQPDFLFPQMTSPFSTRPDWSPSFLDYLYTSFTNATAFSPTDTMPLTAWAKVLMMIQSLASLLTVALVFSRAVNILN